MLAVTFAILASSNMMLAKHIATKDDDPPQFVYRMDTRGDIDPVQNEIFNQGFAARGTTTELVNFITGHVGSIFISTTSLKSFLTTAFAENPYLLINPRIHNQFPPIVYIYAIRATRDNFYGVQRSVKGRKGLSLDIKDKIEREHEWVALRRILNTQVRSVTVLHYDRTRSMYVVGEVINNPTYIELAPRGGNPGPYTDVTIPAINRIANVVANIGYTIAAGLNFCPFRNPRVFNRDINIVNYGIRGSCAYPLVLNIDHWSEELKAYKNYMLSNKLGYMKPWSHGEL